MARSKRSTREKKWGAKALASRRNIAAVATSKEGNNGVSCPKQDSGFSLREKHRCFFAHVPIYFPHHGCLAFERWLKRQNIRPCKRCSLDIARLMGQNASCLNSAFLFIVIVSNQLLEWLANGTGGNLWELRLTTLRVIRRKRGH